MSTTQIVCPWNVGNDAWNQDVVASKYRISRIRQLQMQNPFFFIPQSLLSRSGSDGLLEICFLTDAKATWPRDVRFPVCTSEAISQIWLNRHHWGYRFSLSSSFVLLCGSGMSYEVVWSRAVVKQASYLRNSNSDESTNLHSKPDFQVSPPIFGRQRSAQMALVSTLLGGPDGLYFMCKGFKKHLESFWYVLAHYRLVFGSYRLERATPYPPGKVRFWIEVPLIIM